MPDNVRAAQQWLSSQEQKAIFAGCSILIDSLFDEYQKVDAWKPGAIFSTRLGRHLPKSYSSNYTPLFFKQFGMCIVAMAWKFAQPKPRPPFSIAEQLAGWAILKEAQEILRQENNVEMGKGTSVFQAILKRCFPDTSFLLLFDSNHDKIPANPGAPARQQSSFAFEYWLLPFPGRTQGVHPYAGGFEQVGRAYKHWLTQHEREILATAIEVLIDGIFDDIALQEKKKSEHFALTTLSWYLPSSYSSHYTPLFLKKFVVCILTAAWKLAQPKRMLHSSIAEEMASWAIIAAAKEQIGIDYEMEGKKGGEQTAEYAFENLMEVLFEDEDFLLLFDKKYSGIHASPVGQWLHMTSLAFADWMKPFSDEPDRVAHPYVMPLLER